MTRDEVADKLGAVAAEALTNHFQGLVESGADADEVNKASAAYRAQLVDWYRRSLAKIDCQVAAHGAAVLADYHGARLQ